MRMPHQILCLLLVRPVCKKIFRYVTFPVLLQKAEALFDMKIVKGVEERMKQGRKALDKRLPALRVQSG